MANKFLTIGVVNSETTAEVTFLWPNPVWLEFDPVDSGSDNIVRYFPDLGNNVPILMSFSVKGRLDPVEPLVADGIGRARAVAGVVIGLPEPAVSGGQPSLPQHWASVVASATLIQGASHIHAIPDPNPVWDPRTSGWTYPPPPPPAAAPTNPDAGSGSLRWTVDSLPNPAGFRDGWYWLGSNVGDPSGHPGNGDGWHCSPGSVMDVKWDSFYPFRPSVNSYDGYIPGERTVHHAKGVHFNSHYIEHMWADLPGTQAQPFTWIVVATIMSDRYGGYRHFILDSGQNPDSTGFPHISANQCSTERRIADNLPYRTALAVTNDTAQSWTRDGDGPLQTRGSPGHHPRMYATVFNGTSSKVCVYDPFGKFRSNGSLGGDAAAGPEPHSFIVLGREQGWISQNHACNLLVFEIRYWHYALTDADLDNQYAQLSSTHQFDAYKTL